MKYVFGIILGLFLVSCQTQETVQFKNPIFNRKLASNVSVYDDIVITPKIMVTLNDPEVLPAKCELLSDEGYRIMMKCAHPLYQTTPGRIAYHRFTNTGKYKQSYFQGNNQCQILHEECDDINFQEFCIKNRFTIYLSSGENCGLQMPEDQLPEWF